MPRVSQARALVGFVGAARERDARGRRRALRARVTRLDFGFTLTTVELTIVVALAIGAIAWVRSRPRSRGARRLSLPLAALVLSRSLSARSPPRSSRAMPFASPRAWAPRRCCSS